MRVALLRSLHLHVLRSVFVYSNVLLRISFALAVWLFVAASAVAQNVDACTVIDTDGAIDDYRAIASIVPNHHVSAIVLTEGIATPLQGAGAIENFLGRGGFSVPVIPGAIPNPDRPFNAPQELVDWRDNAERLNGLLSAPVIPSKKYGSDIADALRPFTKNCARVSLLVIGPWTSFMRYGPELLDKTVHIVAPGKTLS